MKVAIMATVHLPDGVTATALRRYVEEALRRVPGMPPENVENVGVLWTQHSRTIAAALRAARHGYAA